MGVLLVSAIAGAQTLPTGCLTEPVDRMFIYDFANQLGAAEEEQLNQKLRHFTDTTSHVIVVVIHPDFCGLEAAQFATAVGHEWGVGRADQDNGIVVAIRPRTRSEGGALFIAPGYGLEGAIPDVVAARVVQEMTPQLSRGDYSGALEKGTHDLMRLAAGEWTESDYLMQGYGESGTGFFAFLLFLLVLLGIPAFAIGSSIRTLQRKHHLNWSAAWILFWAASQRSQGRYNQFHSGSGPFVRRSGGGFGGYGGGGGGGFGGFGGGGFGGGGAGGSF